MNNKKALAIAEKGSRWVLQCHSDNEKAASTGNLLDLDYTALNFDCWCFSSETFDAFEIGARCAYHTGKAPRSLHISRGRNWIVDVPNFGKILLCVKTPFYRDGIYIKQNANI